MKQLLVHLYHLLFVSTTVQFRELLRVEEQRESALSVRDFCDWIGVSQNAFDLWRRKLVVTPWNKLRASKPSEPASISQDQRPDVQSLFAPLTVLGSAVIELPELSPFCITVSAQRTVEIWGRPEPSDNHLSDISVGNIMPGAPLPDAVTVGQQGSLRRCKKKRGLAKD